MWVITSYKPSNNPHITHRQNLFPTQHYRAPHNSHHPNAVECKRIMVSASFRDTNMNFYLLPYVLLRKVRTWDVENAQYVQTGGSPKTTPKQLKFHSHEIMRLTIIKATSMMLRLMMILREIMKQKMRRMMKLRILVQSLVNDSEFFCQVGKKTDNLWNLLIRFSRSTRRGEYWDWYCSECGWWHWDVGFFGWAAKKKCDGWCE